MRWQRNMLSVLPVSLVALLFASPVFAGPTSLNDPFRSLTLQKPKQQDNPICCLKPLATEPVDDGILLSFEEWKMKQSATQPDGGNRWNEKDTSSGGGGGSSGGGGDGNAPAEANSINPEAATPPTENPSSSSSTNPDQLPSGPHFRVPLTDRFNYASLDCSARVHASHRSAKSPSAVLSSKRDRYMLSPCDKSKENHYVVVELCDDIRIDTVQLANFEFFSGVFKDFTVSVAKNYDPDGWTPVATYRAKNVRGVQSFHPPNSLRDFYRFIRIDFLSNYGNEFYCPVSLLRVYGLTHLEEWKWDIWESESRSKQAELQKKRELPPVLIPDPQPVVIVDSNLNIDVKTSTSTESGSTATAVKLPDANNTTGVDSISRGTVQQHLQNVSNQPDTSSVYTHRASSTPTANENPQSKEHPKTTIDTIPHSTDTYVLTPSISPTPPPSENRPQTSHIPTPNPELTSTGTSTPISTQDNINISNTTPSSSNASYASPGTPTIILSSSTPSTAIIPLIPAIKGGESIYRTIMNRLAEVEINQTLYMRYIEQQHLAVREVIKRLGEDVGRLEGISRAQSLTYQRTLNEWEKQRYQMEMEYGDLISRIEYLSQEIILEKRLGVAQLCLLLAVLVFLGLTRGSRAETLVERGSNRFNQSVRDWGKRHFKLSGEWRGRFKGKNAVDVDKRISRSQSRSSSRTRTPPPSSSSRPKPKSTKSYPPHLPLSFQGDDNTITFPSTSRPYRTKEPLETIQLNTAPLFGENHNRPRTISNPRSRAPSLRSTPASRRNHALHARPITPTISTFRPQMLQRSSSHGVAVPQGGSWGTMNAPKSAKKWARTAHLHEVKTTGPAFSAAGLRKSKKADNASPVRHDLDHDRTPREFDFGSENEGAFGLAKIPLNGKHAPPPPPPPANSLLLKTEDDGDPWVDTDSIDESEADIQLGVTI